jgi:hypothetical protein
MRFKSLLKCVEWDLCFVIISTFSEGGRLNTLYFDVL